MGEGGGEVDPLDIVVDDVADRDAGHPAAPSSTSEVFSHNDLISSGSALLTFFANAGGSKPEPGEAPAATSPPADPDRAYPVWNVEANGFKQVSPFHLLPLHVRPKAKLPDFLRAGWLVLEYLRVNGLDAVRFLVQDTHLAPHVNCPHSYIYRNNEAKRRSVPLNGLRVEVDGGGHFWTPDWTSGAAPEGSEGMFACSARDPHGAALLGKCFRRARLVRAVGDRSVKAGDVHYMDDYCFIHLGVREPIEMRPPRRCDRRVGMWGTAASAAAGIPQQRQADRGPTPAAALVCSPHPSLMWTLSRIRPCGRLPVPPVPVPSIPHWLALLTVTQVRCVPKLLTQTLTVTQARCVPELRASPAGLGSHVLAVECVQRPCRPTAAARRAAPPPRPSARRARHRRRAAAAQAAERRPLHGRRQHAVP